MVESVARAIVVTSVVIDLHELDRGRLPAQLAVSTLTLAELAAGPHASGDLLERARRQARLQLAEELFDALPFDDAAARAYGQIYAAVAVAGRSARPRVVALLIAATALGCGLPLYTRNADDLRHLEGLLEVVSI